MMRVLPFQRAHLDLIELSDADIERYGNMTSESENPLADYGINFTAVWDGRVMLVGGVMNASQRTGYAWTMVSRRAHVCGFKLARGVKAHLENMMRDMGIHRVETANLADAFDHHKWCKMLGFKSEGVMWQYDDKKRDYLRFSKIMEV